MGGAKADRSESNAVTRETPVWHDPARGARSVACTAKHTKSGEFAARYLAATDDWLRGGISAEQIDGQAWKQDDDLQQLERQTGCHVDLRRDPELSEQDGLVSRLKTEPSIRAPDP